ncbi:MULTISPECIES: hypothetical protein [Paenibacillus]|uniref:hypothetical protein n=1 Tax=Paenibacillus TaxID=44249 RepID=UPI00096D00D8|nr:hypothetical protein [Paenibacillus odorifer]OME34925.1 hypothetical protein BSK58_24785 [Paenibacillus odorifer]
MVESKKEYGTNGRGRPINEKKKTFNALGEQEIESRSDEERKNLGSKSHTLHFINLLGLECIQTTRNQEDIVNDMDSDSENNPDKRGMKPVGITLISDIDIDVKYMKDVTQTSINIENDFEDPVIIPAGVPFYLTHYEFMFLVTRDEYAGFVSYDGDDRAVGLSVRTDKLEHAKYENGDAEVKAEVDSEPTSDGYVRIKMPTPIISYYKDKGLGSIRDEAVSIDEKVNGKWRIRIEKYNRFAALIPKSKRV